MNHFGCRVLVSECSVVNVCRMGSSNPSFDDEILRTRINHIRSRDHFHGGGLYLRSYRRKIKEFF